MKKPFRSIFTQSPMVWLLIFSLVLSACNSNSAVNSTETAEGILSAQETEVSDAAATEENVVPLDLGPITSYRFNVIDIPTLDPQLAEDVDSINHIENLFVQLTNYDLVSAEVVPEAATSWDISDDGLVYTFHLRTDIPWVLHNPLTGETTQVNDDEGKPRFVTAQDFVNGAYRACNPILSSYYNGVVAPEIAGCADLRGADDPQALTEEDFAAVGVVALDDATVEYTLVSPASYFLSMTPMWTLAAVPQWAIDEHGDAWVEAGNIVTNGRYILNEWVHDVRHQLWRNPLMPADMRGSGNIEVVVTDIVSDASTGYALWLAGMVESAAIPDAELQAHLENYVDETMKVPDEYLPVFYIGFAHDKAPFNNRQVRAAFSAAFDRETFIQEVRQGRGMPMKHFAPPGITHAPPIDEVGVGYNPEYAAEQLAEAGYPNCEGFPQVILLGFSGLLTLRWMEFAQSNWSENLGCDPELIVIEQQSFEELLASTAAVAPTEERPHIWTFGWGYEYGDENNWIGALWCENVDNRQLRPCVEEDDWIEEAREETDQAVRAQLYKNVEEGFFGLDGEFPIAPIFLRTNFWGIHSWYDFTPALFGGAQIYNYSIDIEARNSARQ